MTDSDAFELKRFVDAQERVIGDVERELTQGRKRTHWMWFVFPQIAGLGHSAMAQRYALASRAEAEAYLRHPVLGPRLRRCAGLVNAIEGRAVEEIFGCPDDRKFQSSMTLFAHATDDAQVFIDALAKYFGGAFDKATLERL